MPFSGMEPDLLELHAPEKVERITGLGRDPGMSVSGSSADLSQVAIDILN